ncbi:oligosaccharide flippase family protein [uncultured Photobacterium sp.]|uniref:oligosaccharide flippase family protein n=1 Tax=uncultured Photobacterium sp. TaxID=173973 RepID=UPI00262766AC|nr:oligosaccharide flippase family protein [uncultured Photobacterium sp.]
MNMLKNIIMLFFSQGINFLVPIVLVPYLVRVLGPIEYGKFNLALSIILYGCLFIDFGFNLYSSGMIAKAKNKQEINKTYTITIITKLLLFIPICSVISVIPFYITKFHDIKTIVLILNIQLLSSVISTIWLYQGIEKVRIYSYVNIIIKLSSVPLIFYFVKTEFDLNKLAIIQSSTFLASALILILIATKEKIHFVRIKIEDITYQLKHASPIFLGTVSVSLYTMSTPIILGLVSTAYEVGQYTATDKIRGAFISIFLILSNVIYPRVNKLRMESEPKALRFIKKVFFLQTSLGFAFSILIYLSANFIVHNYLGKDFYQSIILLKIMSPMVIFVPLSVLLSNYLLLSWEYKRYYLTVPIITCICHFIYVIPLSNLYGAIGSGISILLTEIISLLLLLYFVYKSGLMKKIYES